MSEQEFQSIPWQYGNKVRLTNGKQYTVKKKKKRYILLYSDEYKAYFVADHRIVAERTSDKVEDYWANHPETGAIVSYGHHPRLPYLPS